MIQMTREGALELFDKLCEAGVSATVFGRQVAGYMRMPETYWNVAVGGELDAAKLAALGKIADEAGLSIHISLVSEGLSFQPKRVI